MDEKKQKLHRIITNWIQLPLLSIIAYFLIREVSIVDDLRTQMETMLVNQAVQGEHDKNADKLIADASNGIKDNKQKNDDQDVRLGDLELRMNRVEYKLKIFTPIK